MNYKQQELVKELKEFLTNNQKQPEKKYQDQEALEADGLWGATHLFAQFIYQAEGGFLWDLSRLQVFKNDYEAKHNTSINLDKILDRYWLRPVLGWVKIPKAIRSITYDIGKYKDHKLEFDFVLELGKGREVKELPLADFEQAKKKYESEHALNLDQKAMQKYSWIKLDEEQSQVKFENINYYQPLQKHWGELMFLHHFREEYYKTHKLFIKKEVAQRIHQQHQAYFTQTPDIATLKEQEILLPHSDELYQVNFGNTSPRYWDALGTQTSGLLWEKFAQDKGYASNEKRVKVWVEQTSLCGWFDTKKIFQYLTKKNKPLLLDAAQGLILKEPDIEGLDNEWNKVVLDNMLDREFQLLDLDNNTTKVSPHTDYFEFCLGLERLNEKHQNLLFGGQDVRDNLRTLIWLVEQGDDHKFKRLKKLLEAGLQKPFLLWKMRRTKQDFVLELLTKPKYAAFALWQMNGWELANSQETFYTELVSKRKKFGVNLALGTLNTTKNTDNKVKAKFIYQVFCQLNEGQKYKTLNHHHQDALRHYQRAKELHKQQEKAVLELIENYPNGGYFMQAYNPQQNYLLPTLLDELFEYFAAHEVYDKYQNGIYMLPLLKLDGISWILKCATYSKYKKQMSIDTNKVADEFLQTYNAILGIEFIGESMIWSEKFERIERIQWLYPIYYLHQAASLNSFLSPTIRFKASDDKYHKGNRFSLQKLRTHIRVLLQVLQELSSSDTLWGFDNELLQEIKDTVEKQVITYLKEDKKREYVDLFDSMLERAHNATENEMLLPQLGRAIRWFAKPTKITKVLADTNDLTRLLSLTDWITAEGVKKKLFEQVDKTKVKDFLEAQFLVINIELVLSKLIQYPELIEKAEEALIFWKENLLKGKPTDQNKMIAYQAELLLVYHKRDLKALDSVIKPKRSYQTVGRDWLDDLKPFYKGCILFDDSPKEAYKVFDQLSRYAQGKPNSTIESNKFAAKISWAGKESKPELYKEALEEWLNFENTLSSEDKTQLLNSMGDNIWANKLTVYLQQALSQSNEGDAQSYHDQIKELYEGLDKAYQMRYKIAESWATSLVAQGLEQEATLFMNELVAYHQQKPPFFNELMNKLDSRDNLTRLRKNYDEIFNLQPLNLIKVFPPKLNGQEELIRFLVKEIANAADKMLDKVLSIEEIRKENKYNDLVQMVLEARINPWGWDVKNETRGAFSGKNKKTKKQGLGERDIAICDDNSRFLLVCEAFIYSTKKKAQSHISKVFDYYHQRSAFVILVYDMGTRGHFNNKWKKYGEDIIPILSYPKGFGLKQKKIKDLTKEFGYNNSAIKVGKTLHGRDHTEIYHIMVNINYKAN